MAPKIITAIAQVLKSKGVSGFKFIQHIKPTAKMRLVMKSTEQFSLLGLFCIALLSLGMIAFIGFTDGEATATRGDVASMVLSGLWAVYIIQIFRSDWSSYRAKYKNAAPISESVTVKSAITGAVYEEATKPE